ncbi:MAG: hypothetical protein LBF78_12465 [Treponema sp.]|jgi:hypothetical protein|nr:hypothetical protein [Treponema sp.]
MSEYWNLFISYFYSYKDDDGITRKGTEEDARLLYNAIKDCDIDGQKIKIYLHEVSNPNGKFGETPDIVRKCDSLILLANENIPRDDSGTILKHDREGRLKFLYEELDSFRACDNFRMDPDRAAKILVCDGWILNEASALFSIFGGRNHFTLAFNETETYAEVIEWQKQIAAKKRSKAFEAVKIDIPDPIASIVYFDFSCFAPRNILFSENESLDEKLVSLTLEAYSAYDVLSVKEYVARLDFDIRNALLIIKTYGMDAAKAIIGELKGRNAPNVSQPAFFLVFAEKGEKGLLLDTAKNDAIFIDKRAILQHDGANICCTFSCEACPGVSNCLCLLMTNITDRKSENRFVDLTHLPQHATDDEFTVYRINLNTEGLNKKTEFLTLVKEEILNCLREKFQGHLRKNGLLTNFLFENTSLYEADRNSENEIYRIIDSWLPEEIDLNTFFNDYKANLEFSDEIYSRLKNGKYGAVIDNVKTFNQNKKTASIIAAIDELYGMFLDECNKKNFLREEMLLLVLVNLIIHNLFYIDITYLVEHKILERLQGLYNAQFFPLHAYRLETFICTIKKEVFYNGNIDLLGFSVTDAIDKVLTGFGRLIGSLTGEDEGHPSPEYKEMLFLLYRHRSVIYEEQGDMQLECVERRKLYQKWQNDCVKAISISKDINANKEVLGCVYLNLASSQNRLATFYNNEEKLRSLNECLGNLDNAYRLLRVASVDRFVGYVHLHRADCYEKLVDLVDKKNSEDIINKMHSSAVKAFNMFQGTSDKTAQSWSLRVCIKAIVIKAAPGDLEKNLVEAFDKLAVVLKQNGESKNINEIASCITDLSYYISIAREKYPDNPLMFEKMKKCVVEEIWTVNMIISELKLVNEDIIAIQTALGGIFGKLINSNTGGNS